VSIKPKFPASTEGKSASPHRKLPSSHEYL
jgi:hypothetical protein